MGLIFPGGLTDLSNRTFQKFAVAGDATVAERNATIVFRNGVSASTYTYKSSSGFQGGDWQVLRKTGIGDITIARGAGVTFLHEDFPNQDIKIDGNDGYSVCVEAIEEIYTSTQIAASAAGDRYLISGGNIQYARFVAGQKILVSGFTNSVNNGVKTISSFISPYNTLVISETDLVGEAGGAEITIKTLYTYLISGSIKTAA